MNITKAIRIIIKEKRVTQTKLAEMLGYKSQSGVGMRLKSDMQMSTVVQMLDVLDYEVIIQPKSTRGKRANGAYVIDNKEEGEGE